MRVLMVTPGFYPVEGGTETMVRNLSLELNKVGVNVDILAFNMDQKWNTKWQQKIEKIDGIKVFKIPALNWFPFSHSPRLNFRVNVIPGRFTHLMKDYDVIHFHEAEFSFPLFSSFVKKPKILQLHGIRLDYFKKNHLSRLLLKNAADLYISLTKQMKNELVALGIPENKIECLSNAVDTKIFQPKGEKVDNTLLYVGRIAPVKGLHILLESLKYVNNPVELEIMGSPGWNQDYYQKILQLIENENRRGKHKIKYLGHVAPNQASLIERYQKASIFVLSSSYEAFGVVLLEAMACKTPVISTRAGGTPEIIKHGKTGLLVCKDSPIGVAAGINYLLENKDIRIKIGNAGREMVVEKFSIDATVKKLCKIYEKLVNN